MTKEMLNEIENDYWEEKADPIDMTEVFDLANRALEQTELNPSYNGVKSELEPCKDCISRTKLLTRIDEERKHLLDLKMDGAEHIIVHHARRIIEDMPSVTPKARWIPITERLPEDIKPVIVTWKNTDPKSYYQYIVGKHFIGTAHYKNGKWFWYSSVTEDLLAEYGKCDSEEFDEAIEVIAWMPLPTSYQGEENG